MAINLSKKFAIFSTVLNIFFLWETERHVYRRKIYTIYSDFKLKAIWNSVKEIWNWRKMWKLWFHLRSLWSLRLLLKSIGILPRFNFRYLNFTAFKKFSQSYVKLSSSNLVNNSFRYKIYGFFKEYIHVIIQKSWIKGRGINSPAFKNCFHRNIWSYLLWN